MVVISLCVLTLLLAVMGYDALLALKALAGGAFGSAYALLSATSVRAIPLAIAGLSVSIAFRAGILNIGAEGQLLMGATAAAAVALSVTSAETRFENVSFPTAAIVMAMMLCAGAAAGAMWAGIAAFLRRRYAVLEVISTIMLNFLALYLVGYLVRGPLQEPSLINPQSQSLPDAFHLPALFPGTRLHIGALIALLMSVAAWWWLRSTASGFRMRVIGENPVAAESAGRINVARTATGVFLISGAVAGVAGAVEYSGVTYAIYDNFSPGYGYTAIAVALLARLHPIGVLATALLFGALEAGGSAMQRDAGVPRVIVSVVEATFILMVLAGEAWAKRAARLQAPNSATIHSAGLKRDAAGADD